MISEMIIREKNYTEFMVILGRRSASELDTLRECLLRYNTESVLVPEICEVITAYIGDWRGQVTKDALHHVLGMGNRINWYGHRAKLEIANTRAFELVRPKGNFTKEQIHTILVADYYTEGLPPVDMFKLRHLRAALAVHLEKTAHYHNEVLRLGNRA